MYVVVIVIGIYFVIVGVVDYVLVGIGVVCVGDFVVVG